MSEGMRDGLRRRLERARRRIASQHQHLRGLLYDAESAALAHAPLCDCVLRLRDGLRAHFALEDEICFPALHGLDARALSQLERLTAEHGEFLGELERLASAMDAEESM